ncbi:MAG TPA: 50S ribosomal protein L29 [Candidatus Dependentiae bacterium]|nr:50S ribosomal protein L29 [Candidatus Dependentiae bacterium]
MKTRNLKEELKQDTEQALAAKLDASRRELFRMKINVATAHVKDYSQFKKSRRNIARILTYLRQKASL